jgi:2,4-dienoyl-CoA reductase-like NADH-dependent reductase (Old Yellow Enzyme family)
MYLAQPLRLRSGLVLTNRIAKAAMTEGLATRDGHATAALEQLYRLWSRSGAGLLITGNVMFDGRYLERPGNVIVEDERCLDALAAWATSARGAGVPVLMQVNHPGRQTSRYISADFQRGGFEEPEALRVVELSEGEGVDLLEISGGTYESPAMYGLGAGSESTRAREAYFLGFAAKVRRTTRLPLMVTGGFRSAGAMERALASDELDVVGLARPMLIDPSVPRTLLASSTTMADTPRLPFTNRSLAALAETAWYDHQLQRLADGAPPDVSASVHSLIARCLSVTAARGILHRMTYRPSASAAKHLC